MAFGRSTEDAAIAAMAEAAEKIAEERDAVERQIKALLEQGKDAEALALMRSHLNVAAPKQRSGRAQKA